MRRALLDYLCCPVDRGQLHLNADEEAQDGHVLEGTLKCLSCGTTYSIRRGVPRLLTGTLAGPEQQTQERFGFEWQWYRNTNRVFGVEFWDYLKPLEVKDLRGKAVLDAGCGNGRFAIAAAAAGAKAVIGLDFSLSVEVAFEAARGVPNLHIVQGDILKPPVKKEMDLIYSIGVLHHLENPKGGFEKLVPYLAPGGTIAVWVYSKEGNEWFLRWVEPVRRVVTAKLPPALVKILAFLPAVFLWLEAALIRSPLGKRLRLPLHEYLSFQGQFGFGYLWLTAFDKLVAPTAFYLTEKEVREWLKMSSLQDSVISFRNNSGWRAQAVRTA